MRRETRILTRPKAGKVEIMPLNEIKPGMKATAWTVFQGTEPEPVPIEIVGLLKNMWGPRQDIIIGKMGGKAIRTNVAGGMSGSPVYIDGKLIGAVALRLSVFSPDAICGITPIELMLEINDFDKSRPADARTPDKVVAQREVTVPSECWRRRSRRARRRICRQSQTMVPIETPLIFSGFHDDTLQRVRPAVPAAGRHGRAGRRGGSDVTTSKPAAGWETR